MNIKQKWVRVMAIVLAIAVAFAFTVMVAAWMF
jgi:hypothetical protein